MVSGSTAPAIRIWRIPLPSWLVVWMDLTWEKSAMCTGWKQKYHHLYWGLWYWVMEWFISFCHLWVYLIHRTDVLNWRVRGGGVYTYRRWLLSLVTNSNLWSYHNLHRNAPGSGRLQEIQNQNWKSELSYNVLAAKERKHKIVIKISQRIEIEKHLIHKAVRDKSE